MATAEGSVRRSAVVRLTLATVVLIAVGLVFDLEDPDVAFQGNRVLHLRYQVARRP